MARPATTRHAHDPDYAVAPGATLAETIDALSMSQRDLAKRTGYTEKHISQIINGAAPITYQTAEKLEMVTGVPARMWNTLEANYREQLAKQSATQRLDADLEWLDRIPVKELVARGAIEAQPDRPSLLRAVLRFFRVISVEIWENLWLRPATAFRRSKCFEMKPEAMATWLRLGELEAQQIKCAPFDRAKLVRALKEIRALTSASPAVFQPRMIALCSEAGVAVVFVPEIKGCPASGAARWLASEKALIQLSLRYKSNDQFWFSFFHEAGHILGDGKKEVFIDGGSGDDDASESAANRFAADLLIPPARASELPTLETRHAVERFARDIGIAPGIVVGRLQREGRINYSYLNELKVKLVWATD
jgi:addiction module HigA family antidote